MSEPSSISSLTSACTGESEAKREQILTGAYNVFAEHGYEGASMSAIAREAGVSKGTLYNYFTNKADLFGAFVEKCCREKLPPALAPVQKEASPKETLTAVARAMVQLITQPESLMLYRMIVSEAPHFPQLATIFWSHGPRIAIETLSNWIREQTQRGTLKTDDPVFAAEQFFSLCQTRIAHRKRFNMPYDNMAEDEEKVIHASVSMFLATYGT
ncbi:TetR/AcrR family transcriptional regulator [Acetobacter ascendens]|uniref:HTH-type transcriptional repressor AcnR n=1 Tax=Acetobacter ascendens TaxID=481146 RepID=A0A1Y0V3E1_9PROT|nr:TetR/AcrR family transcriptional regulator [Acetobacter ascendens]AOW48795.1 TetR family transcriptional regulator [Acetobacter ascendens]ARW10469.1 HTH-type transcriptional repressor AcnR [Acetobacter ascendens]RCL04912.1 TetR family transcriptional regulator [Acetobacter pasteurianus]GCD76115.1 TetR family transcriptional regulator [Acetobacter pasteurianus NBRC 3299]